MKRRPPRSTQGVSSAASDVYKRQRVDMAGHDIDGKIFVTVYKNMPSSPRFKRSPKKSPNRSPKRNSSVSTVDLIRENSRLRKKNKILDRAWLHATHGLEALANSIRGENDIPDKKKTKYVRKIETLRVEIGELSDLVYSV